MSTHGNILILNKDDERQQGIWLHAYSDGHDFGAYEMLVGMPAWLVERAVLARALGDPSLGPGWYLEQFNPDMWRYTISACIGDMYKCRLAGLLCARYALRWCPLPEAEAPWHTVGDPPDITVICYGESYEVIPQEPEEEMVTVRVAWLEQVYALLSQRAVRPSRNMEHG